MLLVQNGIAAMTWGCSGYRLVLAEAGMSAQVLELSLAKSPRGSHRILHPCTPQAGSGIPAPSEIHILQVRHFLNNFGLLPGVYRVPEVHLCLSQVPKLK